MAVPGTFRRTDQTAFFDEPVEKVPYARGKRLNALHTLGIYTIRDLLHYYPFRYNDFSDVILIRDAPLGVKSSIFGTIDEVKIKPIRRNLTIIEVSILDKSGILYATWFNQPWLVKNLIKGTKVFLLGKVEHSYGFKRMANPLLTLFESLEDAEKNSTNDSRDLDDTSPLAGSIYPVYHSNAGVSTAWIARIVKTALELMPAPFDPLEESLRNALGLMSYQGALREIHQPTSQKSRAQARRRLAFDEVFFLLLQLKRERKIQSAMVTPFVHKTNGPSLLRLPELLPFTLSDDQLIAIKEILIDMESKQPMNRLLLGDVGSGKTIVAAHALVSAYDSGFQAAMMAPTEVLVQQYAIKIGPLLDELGIPWALLTSSVSAESRRRILEQLEAGNLCIIFGTHALLEPDVRFKNLSLVVIDEQHRFGVDQRARMRAKGTGCDALMMTATPIPRSLALVVYGDLMPTYLYTSHHISTTSTKVLDRSMIGEAYEAIRAALDRGCQAYVICPLITPTAEEQTETPLIDLFTDFEMLDDRADIRAATREAGFLADKVFPSHTVGLLTGRMTPEEKRTTMDRFRKGEIHVLVSTTVVEVGIDVPNATVMIIEDADRFGLTQLHQLRGRIGRGEWDGELFLITRMRDEDSSERLRLLERIRDGFELAREDLRLRREGDVLGNRQHGIAQLKLIKILDDEELIASANNEATALLESDWNLTSPEHSYLVHELLRRVLGSDDGEKPCAS